MICFMQFIRMITSLEIGTEIVNDIILLWKWMEMTAFGNEHWDLNKTTVSCRIFSILLFSTIFLKFKFLFRCSSIQKDHRICQKLDNHHSLRCGIKKRIHQWFLIQNLLDFPVLISVNEKNYWKLLFGMFWLKSSI